MPLLAQMLISAWRLVAVLLRGLVLICAVSFGSMALWRFFINLYAPIACAQMHPICGSADLEGMAATVPGMCLAAPALVILCLILRRRGFAAWTLAFLALGLTSLWLTDVAGDVLYRLFPPVPHE